MTASKSEAKAAPSKLGPRPATRDHLVSGKKPLRIRHQVVLDNELSDALVTARAAYELAEAHFKAKPTDVDRQAAFDQAEAAYREAQEAAQDGVFEVVLQGMGRHRFDLLKRKHPPTEQDIKDADKVGIESKHLDFSPQTFPPAVIAASMVEPSMGEEEVRSEIWESDAWNAAEAQGLYLAAMRANESRATADLGKASSGMRSSG